MTARGIDHAGPLIYLVAGEPSGDRLGGALMAAIRSLRPDVRFAGLGGQEMKAEGLDPIFDLGELSVMGITEVVPRLPVILKRMGETIGAIEEARPDLLVTIDSPSFSLRVAKRARAARPELRTVHYVAPTVWAWRPKRAKRMARFTDHVLALLPFEPPYMEAAGMSCDFVGHPIAERPVVPEADVQSFRAEIGGDGPLLLMAPGSRRGEIDRLLSVFRDTVERVARDRPDLRVVVPLAETVATEVREGLAGMTPAPHLVEPETGERRKRVAMAAADAALVASGTVTLEMAAAGTPMVAAYRASPVTAAIVRRLLRVDTANLVNLTAGSRTVPEFYQEDATPGRMAPVLADLLARGPAWQAQRDEMDRVMELLGRGGDPPSVRAARSVLAQL